MIRGNLFVVLGALVFSLSANAGDEKAMELLDEAYEHFDLRKPLSQDVTVAKEVVQKADQALAEAQDRLLKYEILILKSKAYYWMGRHRPGRDEKMELFKQSGKAASAARKLDDSVTEGHYWYAIALGRWAKAKGIAASLGKLGTMMKAINLAKTTKTLEGDNGEEIEGYGPDRTLGRVYFSIPKSFGGSLKKSYQHLDKAHRQAPNYAGNIVFLAETLHRKYPAKACQLLVDMLAKDPQTFNVDRIPETIDEFADAKALKKRLCQN